MNELKNTGAKVMYIVYGPGIFYSEESYVPKLPTVVDTSFVDSESTKEIFIEHFKFPENRVAVSGTETLHEIRERLKPRDNNKKETILWLPRYTVSFKRNKYESGSTFLSYHYFFYNYALANPNINFIIRPHILMYNNIKGAYVSFSVAHGFLNRKDLDQIFDKFRSLPNVKISIHGMDDLTDSVLESDVVLTDGTSAIAEVIAANKPIIYLSNGYNTEFDSTKISKELVKNISLVYTPLEATIALRNIRTNNYVANYPEEFKKMVDPIENPAKFISNYLLHLSK